MICRTDGKTCTGVKFKACYECEYQSKGGMTPLQWIRRNAEKQPKLDDILDFLVKVEV